VSLPALALLLAVGLGALAVVRDQVDCVGAARDVALAYARGDSPPAVSGTVAVTNDGDVVRVVVTRHRSLLGGALPGIDITATAVAAVEPGE
jgi:hypothetical protein